MKPPMFGKSATLRTMQHVNLPRDNYCCVPEPVVTGVAILALLNLQF
jgi:hypothetical protein